MRVLKKPSVFFLGVFQLKKNKSSRAFNNIHMNFEYNLLNLQLLFRKLNSFRIPPFLGFPNLIEIQLFTIYLFAIQIQIQV